VTYPDFLLPTSLTLSTSFTAAQRLLSAVGSLLPEAQIPFFISSPVTGHRPLATAAQRPDETNEINEMNELDVCLLL
jgi:hypothetical protein